MEWLSPEAWIGTLRDLGPLAIPVCLLLMTVSSIVPIPAELPAMLNGAVLGLWTGSVVTWVGAMLGAWVSYAAAAWLHARFGAPWLGTRGQARVSTLGRETGALELVVLRLTPVVAFHLINYVAGMARIPRARFLWTTGLGILPGTFAFTAGGMVVSDWMSHPAVRWGSLGLVLLLVGWRVSRRLRTR
jgi:uncharacterized membrane protein YdjX (TVP38/TMEM64 family)